MREGNWVYAIWHTLGAIAAITVGAGLLTVVGFGIFTNHRPVGYYIGPRGVSDVGQVSCVYASNPWEGDDKVFCSADPAEVFQFWQLSQRMLAAPIAPASPESREGAF